MSLGYCFCFGPSPTLDTREIEDVTGSRKVPSIEVPSVVKPSSSKLDKQDSLLSSDSSTATEETDEPEEEEEDVLECDYDLNVTRLYQRLEDRDWESCLMFLRTGKWSSSIFAFSDESPPSVQARTWVTAYEEHKANARVKWSLLPLHAAIAFNAPFDVVRELVDLYPRGVRCADDQEMLPLHTAFRFGASDQVVALLLEEFAAALTARGGRKKRTALDMAQYGPNPHRTQIINTYIDFAVRSARNRWEQEKSKDLKRALSRGQEVATSKYMQTKAAVTKELEVTKKRLDDKNQKMTELTTRLAKARKELQDLRGELFVKGLQNEQKDGKDGKDGKENDDAEIKQIASRGSILDLLGDSEDDDIKGNPSVEVADELETATASPNPSFIVALRRTQSFKSAAGSVKDKQSNAGAGFGKVFRRSRLFRRKSNKSAAA